MLLNAVDPGEIRVAILEDGQLAEIFVERQSNQQQTGNIYKARVVNIEPSLQAAFVDLGSERNGFLHVSDCLSPGGGFQEILQPEKSAGKRERAAPDQVSVHEKKLEENAEDIVNLDANPDSKAATVGKGDEQKGRARTPSKRVPMEAPKEFSAESNVPEEDSQIVEFGQNQDRPQVQQPEDPCDPSIDDVEQETEAVGQASVQIADNGQDPIVEVSNHEQIKPVLDLDNEADSEDATVAELAEFQQEAEPSQEVENQEANAAEGGRKGRQPSKNRSRKKGKDANRRPVIQDVLTKGQDILVQVAKEGMGQKGPALTTYLSIPGRYLVLMPAVHRLGVSKRIENEERRRQLKDILTTMNIPAGMGVIVRTVGMDGTREKFQQDLDYLFHRWENIKKRTQSAKAPNMVYQEGDVVTRVFRDVFSDDVSEIIIDDSVVFRRAKEFLKEIAPGAESKIRKYSEQKPIFHKFGVESQMHRLFNRKVNLKSGGSIVIEQTEALVAIDVNTGRYRQKGNQDDTILGTNLEAAREIARQLRLRDFGGLVMVDFIDMEVDAHKKQVENEFRTHLARDKARINMLPISSLGIVEMTRQRMRHSLRRTLFKRCAYCEGAGQLKSAETMGLEILRELRAILSTGGFSRGRVSLHPQVAFEILNNMRTKLTKFEEANGRPIEVHSDPMLPLSQWKISTTKASEGWAQGKVSEVDDYVRNS